MTTLTPMKCGQCGVDWALASETVAHLRMSSQTFYCPFGHQRHFPQGQSETDKLRQERDRLKQETARLQESIDYQRNGRELAERRASAARGQVTRLKNRAAAGLCPCCNRSFTNLQRHMATKHAGFTVEEIQEREGVTVQ